MVKVLGNSGSTAVDPPDEGKTFVLEGEVPALVNTVNIYYTYNMAAILVKNVPDEVRNRFKAVCAEQGKTMREGIIELMTDAIERRRTAGQR
jgi:hypothetical protein